MDIDSDRAGVKFIYSPDCVVPQIPNVLDVEYVLQLSEQDEAYQWCLSNHEPYVVNVHRAAVAASFLVVAMACSAEEARLVIAEVIIELCPEQARCLFEPAFVDVEKLAGYQLPPLNIGRDELRRHCTCRKCRRIVREENDIERSHTD